MRNIYYISNTHDECNPNNKRSKFTTFLQPSTLDYLPDGDLECAVKSITLDATRDFTQSHTYQCLGLQSNLIKTDSISSGKWDKLLCWTHLEKKQTHLYTEFKNPTFFPTTRELLSRASFEFIDLDTNKPPSFTQQGNSTLIQVVVKQQAKRMKHPFQIHLDSSCKISKEYFPTNTNMEFSIQLPKRLVFEKNWCVALKSISFGNSIHNVTNCWVKITRGEQIIEKKIEDGHYSTIKKFVDELNKKLDGMLAFSVAKDPYEGYLFINSLVQVDKIEFSDNLRKLLKLSATIKTAANSKWNTKQTVALKNFRTGGKITLSELLPTHFLVCCNFVENSIYGDKQMPVLKYQPITKADGTILNFDFLYSDYLQMKMKSFDSIKIQIVDSTGLPLKCSSNIPTRLQLLFVNTNTA